MALPKLPGHRVRLLDEAPIAPADRGFMFMRRLTLGLTFSDGTESAPFPYFTPVRSRMDAVVIVPHYQANGETMVVLRSSVRPPLAIRETASWPIAPNEPVGELWEVPAGLVEEDEANPEGLRVCAARELMEETGLEIDLGAVSALGPPAYPSAGLVGECFYFFHGAVDPTKRVVPSEDGSALERLATIIDIPLRVALEACRAGEVQDAKTEIALRRFAEHHA